LRAQDIDIIIRGYKTTADEVWKSTGLTLWKASHYLCQYQIEHGHSLFRGKRVLELGAGLGLNGILAWKIMCSLAASYDDSIAENSVCITDGDSDALVHLRQNIQRNRSTPTEENENVHVSCHQLLWGASSSLSFLQQIAQHRKYHVILASDIIYAPSIIEPLWETVQTLMDQDGVFVMAFARRKVPVSIDLVLQEAETHGFSYHLAKQDTEEGIWVYAFKFA
jgi:predicted nicotinamide N-methyase